MGTETRHSALCLRKCTVIAEYRKVPGVFAVAKRDN